MSRVSDMVKMYSQPNLKPAGNRPGAPGGVQTRRWPPVATPGNSTGPRPPMKPKPFSSPAVNGGRPSTAPKPFHQNAHTKPNDNIAPWKRDLENRNNSPFRKDDEKFERNEEESRENETPEEDPSIPAWKRELMKAKAEAAKPKENKPAWMRNSNDDKPKPTPSWQKPKPEDSKLSTHNGPQWPKQPPPKPPTASKPATVPWSQRNRQQNDDDDEFPPPPPDAPKPGANDFPVPKRPPFHMFETPPNPMVERKSGSFGSGSFPKPTKDDDSKQGSPQKRVASFLHTKPTTPIAPRIQAGLPPPPPASEKPAPPSVNGIPARLQIPREKLLEPPPVKTSKPPHVVLPNKGKKKFSLPSLPTSLLSRSSNSSTSRDQPEPPPAGVRDLPPPPLAGGRDLPLPPPIGGRDLPLPPGSLRDLPAPPPTGNRDLPPPPPMGRDLPSPNHPPSLPSRPMGPPSPALPSRPIPSPIPGKKSMPLPPAPIDTDDIYDDPGEEPPPLPALPPPLVKQESSGLIETWDDEEDDEAIYDETADDAPPPRMPMQDGFPGAGSVPDIPEDGEDMYEDVEEYMRLKKIKMQQRQTPAANGSANANEGSRKDKKKKESEKKEKDIRKKFKLPAEGDIIPEGRGVGLDNCKAKGGKGLAISAGEEIEVIRMGDNPKGKWLIRNSQGEYGYVDSDKVQIDINRLRSTFGVGSHAPSGIGGGPAVPMIPTEDDEDVIYDQTADEDIYEEV